MNKPDVTHVMEQIGAHLRDFSPVVRSYYQGLITSGFSAQEALELVKSFQTSILAMAISFGQQRSDS